MNAPLPSESTAPLGATPPEIPKKRLAIFAAVAAGVLVIAFVLGYLPKRRRHEDLMAASEAMKHAKPRIEVLHPKVVSSDRAIMLPGSVQPLQETVLYARASGYVHSWNVDIGDPVEAGQLLALIDSPELEEQLAQAKAQLAQTQASLVQAKANRGLAKTNLARYEQLRPSGVVSQADLEQSQAQAQVGDANVSVADANVAAQEANIRRLRQLMDFTRVLAPFKGTVTQRSVEIGALVTAGNGQPLFKVAAMDPARIFVQVPQDLAPGVRSQVDAKVTVREYPGVPFPGTISRTSHELDSSTRTMNTEIRVPNGKGLLIAGMYAEVAMTLPSPHQVLELPATVLMNDAAGERVAVIDSESRLHLTKVSIERDNGASIEVSNGLHETDRVAKIGSAAFEDGQEVEVVTPAGMPAAR
jgi:membrane fusion protein (multidrug efflux system)